MPTNDLASENVAPEPGLRFRTPSPSDGLALWRLAGAVGLDLNSPYAYVLWGEHFAATSIVAARGGSIVGFVTGFRPPELPDTLYVDMLIGPDTVNTLPEATLEAFEDHGTVARTVDADPDGARRTWSELGALVDLGDVAAVLEAEGVTAFEKSFDELLGVLETRMADLRG